jgi:predicted metalloprotease with PDZ domain
LNVPTQAAHEFGVSLTFVAQGDECLELPSWIPGSYMVRNFAQHLHDLKAVDEKGRVVTLKKLDKQALVSECSG